MLYGIISVELLNEEIWEWLSDEIFRTAMKKARAML